MTASVSAIVTAYKRVEQTLATLRILMACQSQIRQKQSD
jgi:hypothetical protein